MNSARFAAALVFVATIGSAAPALEELTDHTYAVPAATTLSVRNTDGTIYIYGSEKNEIRIVARKKAYTRERLEKIAVNVKIDGGSATIDTVFPPKVEGLSFADRSGTVDYVLVVPQSCAIAQAELARGEIILEGLRGPAARARLTNGRLIARNCFAETTNVAVKEGMLDIYYDWWEPLKFALTGEIGRGHIRSSFPDYASLGLDAASGDGKIENHFAAPERTGGGARSVQMAIGNGVSAEIKLRADNGNITVNRLE